MLDVLGQALLDFQLGHYTEDIITYSSVAGQDVLQLPYLFRNYDAMPALEKKAMALCNGAILDIGCGAGVHSLYLQENGYDVTGLDNSKGAIDTCKLRGLKKSVLGTIASYYGTKFDTILLLMNGIGLAGDMANLDNFLFQLKAHLKRDGQVLLDSSDIVYMYDVESASDIHTEDQTDKNYYGEVRFTMEYRGIESVPFNWLYIDIDTLKLKAENNGLCCELVMEGPHYDYLARLCLK